MTEETTTTETTEIDEITTDTTTVIAIPTNLPPGTVITITVAIGGEPAAAVAAAEPPALKRTYLGGRRVESA